MDLDIPSELKLRNAILMRVTGEKRREKEKEMEMIVGEREEMKAGERRDKE